MHGTGKQVWLNNDVYIGPYVNGVPHGPDAIWRNDTTNELYKGGFEDGLRSGWGIWYVFQCSAY